MSNQLPQINVLIANYNYQEYVINAIESALNQTYPNIAITFVDSASTDDSWQVVYKKFFKGKMHERVFPHQYEVKRVGLQGTKGNTVTLTAIKLDAKRGPSFARNVGIENAIANTFAFAILDADYEMAPNKVDRLFREMAQLPQAIGAVYADYDTLNVKNGITQREYKPTFSRDSLLQNCIVHSGSLVSSAALLAVKDKNGYYDEQLQVAEDWDLWLRISTKFMILHVPEPLTLVRVSPKNSSAVVPPAIWQESWKRVSDKLNGVVE